MELNRCKRRCKQVAPELPALCELQAELFFAEEGNSAKRTFNLITPERSNDFVSFGFGVVLFDNEPQPGRQ